MCLLYVFELHVCCYYYPTLHSYVSCNGCGGGDMTLLPDSRSSCLCLSFILLVFFLSLVAELIPETDKHAQHYHNSIHQGGSNQGGSVCRYCNVGWIVACNCTEVLPTNRQTGASHELTGTCLSTSHPCYTNSILPVLPSRRLLCARWSSTRLCIDRYIPSSCLFLPGWFLPAPVVLSQPSHSPHHSPSSSLPQSRQASHIPIVHSSVLCKQTLLRDTKHPLLIEPLEPALPIQQFNNTTSSATPPDKKLPSQEDPGGTLQPHTWASLMTYLRASSRYDPNPPRRPQPTVKLMDIGQTFRYLKSWEPPPPLWIRCSKPKGRRWCGRFATPPCKFVAHRINPNLFTLDERLHRVRGSHPTDILRHLPHPSVLPTDNLAVVLYCTAFSDPCKALQRAFVDYPYAESPAAYPPLPVEWIDAVLQTESGWLRPPHSKQYKKPPKRIDVNVTVVPTEEEVEWEKLEKERISLGLARTTSDLKRKTELDDLRKLREEKLEKVKEEYRVVEKRRFEDREMSLTVQYPCPQIGMLEITNSLVIARATKSLKRQKRMLNKGTQLRHHELALSCMIQQDILYGNGDLPCLQFYEQSTKRLIAQLKCVNVHTIPMFIERLKRGKQQDEIDRRSTSSSSSSGVYTDSAGMPLTGWELEGARAFSWVETGMDNYTWNHVVTSRQRTCTSDDPNGGEKSRETVVRCLERLLGLVQYHYEKIKSFYPRKFNVGIVSLKGKKRKIEPPKVLVDKFKEHGRWKDEYVDHQPRNF
eukprot:GHVQ01034245.1.p1 GENE.GHVQ01034245.1~~GHVQ01034245.1.p1  ORF type:complete len:757 (-),score=119.09 GHVQ01034245.1:569-2839(-)